MASEAEQFAQQAFDHRLAGRLDESIAAYHRAIEAGNTSHQCFSNLGEALNEAERNEEAIAPLVQAIEINPQFAPAYSNLGVGMMRLGRLDDAISLMERAIALAPQSPRQHVDLGLALLTRAGRDGNDWARGWDECEWRWRIGQLDVIDPQFRRVPQWDGSPLNGRTILLHTEQGFGDSLLFVRYVPLFTGRFDGKVIVGCEPELHRLFESVPGVQSIVPVGNRLPQVDVRCSMPSLPRFFQTRPATVPSDNPYLRVKPELIERWKSRMPGDGKLSVGVCWSGRMMQAAHRIRRIPPSMFNPLAQVPDIQWFNLQKGATPEDQASSGLEMLDLTSDLTDFAETAAMMMNLDLIITADTSIPHLAGALGRPTWTMLPFCADWRWSHEGQTTPWFPNMRLFRQSAPGEWAPVIDRILAELHQASRR